MSFPSGVAEVSTVPSDAFAVVFIVPSGFRHALADAIFFLLERGFISFLFRISISDTKVLSSIIYFFISFLLVITDLLTPYILLATAGVIKPPFDLVHSSKNFSLKSIFHHVLLCICISQYIYSLIFFKFLVFYT